MVNGSRRNFVYVTDAGEDFVYQADESWTEQVVAEGGGLPGSSNYGSLSTAVYNLPRNLKPRYITLISDTGNRRIEVVCPNREVYDGIALKTVFNVVDPANPNDQTLRVQYKTGERILLPRINDTNLNDGDNP